MKTIFFSTLFVLLTHCASAQLTMLGFLQGTWKIQNKEKYEHWDVLNKEMMKGISYSTVNGQMRISEYMELRSGKDSITYIAHVINQNNGNGIPFTLVQSDSIFSFENPAHDFPKKIEYIPKSATQILVRVSDGKKKGFSYILEKQVAKNIQKDTMNTNPNYDAKLAEKLNADDYGMKKYVLVILKTGSNQSEDKDFISQCFRGHLDNINRLVKEGKMIVAGPIVEFLYSMSVILVKQSKSWNMMPPSKKDYWIWNYSHGMALPHYRNICHFPIKSGKQSRSDVVAQ
jgi:hypothetical protein